MLVALTIDGENRKLGKMTNSTTSAETCPDACALKRKAKDGEPGGCYAAYGPQSIHWRKITQGLRGVEWSAFCNLVSALPKGKRAIWRHNVAGDLPGTNNTLDVRALRQLVKAAHGTGGFTYTHKPLTTRAERAAIKAANDAGFTVNLSADNPIEADRKAALGIGPVVVILPSDQLTNCKTPGGRNIVICPYYTRPGTTCDSCRLCARTSRAIVGFPAHGAAAKTVSERVREALRNGERASLV